MGLFGIGKKRKVLDLTEDYKNNQRVEKARSSQKSSIPAPTSGSSPFSFFDSSTTTSQTIQMNSDVDDSSYGSEERKRKLAKRILDMTEKVEDLSNQIYHLQQRLEVLEKKTDVRRF